MTTKTSTPTLADFKLDFLAYKAETDERITLLEDLVRSAVESPEVSVGHDGDHIASNIGQPKSHGIEVAGGDMEIYERLATWRRDRAEVEGVEAYRIFGNAVLAAIAGTKPHDRFEFQQIKGIGYDKTQKYADDVLGIVRDYCAEKGWDPATKPW